MTREEAFSFLKQHLTKPNLLKHSLAVEAAMRGLAGYFHEDKGKWGLAGLLHDIDYEEVKGDPQRHSLVGAEMLQEKGLDSEVVQAVKTHNEAHHLPPQTLMAKALFCVDPLTGLIVANTLILPSRKIADLTIESVLKHFRQPSFAEGANREIISQSKDLLNLELPDFIGLVLKSMQGISTELGL